MELHFQQTQQQTPLSTSKTTKFKGRARTNNKFVGVRQRPSGRWVAEIKDTTKNIRMWLGTFETAEEAARAYDEAACLLRGSNTRTNFITTVSSSDSPIASRIRNLLNLKKHNNKSSHRPSTTDIPKNTSTSTSTSTCTSTNTIISNDKKKEESFDEEVYRPCFVNEDHDQLDFCNSGSDNSWAFESGFDQIPFFDGFELSRSDCFQETITSELDVMKVERQISASLYAMNGVQEYLDAINDSSDSLWDLPPLYHNLCRG